MPTGRFAPSPTGPLHVGNLRTAVLAWLFARSSGGRFLVRVEDLDRVASRDEHVAAHLADLRALGIDWDGEVVRQSQRFDRYEAALARLEADGLLYPCYCTRREVQAAVAAPHGPLPEGAYPGTCRDLTPEERAARAAEGRRPSWRVRAGGERVEVVDRLHGRVVRAIDDFVVRRADGAPAYQLAVVVDDHEQGVEEVVRGDDLLDTTPRQVWLARRLGLRVPAYTHVPLVLGPDGQRLAKRHGAVTLAQLRAGGVEPDVVLGAMAASLGLAPPGTRVASVADLLPAFDPAALPATPWTFDPDRLA
ncbi:MAG: tRNA glutamyl-Q(34) synthetase GluQRS [Thermoanaerobacterales bacterium]|nr:tRNA glutamyl-Q(34) synthetase GluQRS [Thermoanaerobacterales bacterium]